MGRPEDDEPTRVRPPDDATVVDDATRIAPKPADATVVADDVTRISPSGQPAPHDDLTRAMPRGGRSAAATGHRVFRPGSLIRNRFRLEKQIGQGGMGVVYIARDLRKEEVGDQDSLVAIKLLSENFKVHPNALRMLQQETRKAQKLAHPNVVTVYDFDRDGETVYMTMEYLTGAPLTDYIQEHAAAPGELADVLPIIRDIVHGLQYAHDRGIVHSDLKPANIFLTDEGTAKILDFGIARAMMDKGELKQRSQAKTQVQDFSRQSDTEQLIALTPKYASPEMFEDAPPDARDDIYALACITYELLAGEHPFDGRPANEVKDLELAPKRIPGLSDRQWKGLLQGLSLVRETRTASAEAFLEAFLPKRKEPWRWATLVVGLLTIVVVVYFVLRPPQEAPLSEQDQAVVNQEIEVARQHMEVGSLGNALENYKMILALPPYDKEPPGGGFVQHPYDHVASKDLEQLLDEFARQAQAAIEEGRWQDARSFVDAGLAVDKEHDGLNDVAAQLSKHKQK